MKITIKLSIYFISCLFISACSNNDNIQELTQLSDIITGKWSHTQYKSPLVPPYDEWHVNEDIVLLIDFNGNGNLSFSYPNTEEDLILLGNYEVMDSTSTIIISIETEPYQNRFEYRISEFTDNMFIREYQTDEGFVYEQFEKIK